GASRERLTSRSESGQGGVQGEDPASIGDCEMKQCVDGGFWLEYRPEKWKREPAVIDAGEMDHCRPGEPGVDWRHEAVRRRTVPALDVPAGALEDRPRMRGAGDEAGRLH